MDSPTAIAIVGLGCRFPGGANSLSQLWTLLKLGRDTWTTVPPTRWKEASFYHPDSSFQGAYNHRGGHFIDQDITAFDGAFFGLSPSECAAMDPQQRSLLEVAYETLENAGFPLQEARGADDMEAVSTYHSTGTGLAIMANRVSYVLDLRGPSVTLDTGCSGSLVAVHQACRSLQTGDCSLALAGGVNLMLSPDSMIAMSQLGILSDDGKCQSFGTGGTGYGRGEGVGMVALKRLDDAMRDGDPIRAIIRGSGINQDGKTNGITLPNSEAQRRLVQRVYEKAGLNPRDTCVVEAHGTGTTVGDPAEVDALRRALGQRDIDSTLFIGSLKPNIGHLESASGIASLIKSVLMLEHREIAATINIDCLNPKLNLHSSRIKVPQEHIS